MSYEFEYEALPAEGEIVVSFGEGGYDWHQLEVWKRKRDGRLFMASGSGCSCSSLYDDILSWDDMVAVTSERTVIAELDAWYSDRPKATEVIEGMKAIRRALAPRRGTGSL